MSDLLFIAIGFLASIAVRKLLLDRRREHRPKLLPVDSGPKRAKAKIEFDWENWSGW